MVSRLAKDPAHLIIAVSRTTKTLAQLVRLENTHNVLPLKADISSAAGRKQVYKTVRSLGLPLDVLVNNAGNMVNKPFSEISEKELRAVYETNVFAPFSLIQTLLPLMNRQRRSHIVNIGSMGGVQGSSKFPGLSAYSSSKAALSGLTECLAEELKPENVSVNCLALGAVQTEMLARAFPGYQAPLKAIQMAEFICHFVTTGQNYFNGKIIPVASTTP